MGLFSSKQDPEKVRKNMLKLETEVFTELDTVISKLLTFQKSKSTEVRIDKLQFLKDSVTTVGKNIREFKKDVETNNTLVSNATKIKQLNAIFNTLNSLAVAIGQMRSKSIVNKNYVNPTSMVPEPLVKAYFVDIEKDINTLVELNDSYKTVTMSTPQALSKTG